MWCVLLPQDDTINDTEE